MPLSGTFAFHTGDIEVANRPDLSHSPSVQSPRSRIALILKLLLVLVLGFGGWVGWYFYRRGFTREWRDHLVKELRKQGLEVSVNRMTLDPFRGLIVHGVVIYDSPERRWILAEINRATLDVSVAGLVRGEPFLNAVDFREATVSIPLDSRMPESPKLDLTEFSGRIYFLAGRISVRQTEGEIEGIRFAAAGTLLHNKVLTMKSEQPPMAAEREWVKRILEELREFGWEGDAAPVLNLEFSGAVDEPGRLSVDCSFAGKDLTWREVELRDFRIEADISSDHVNVERVYWRDPVGEFRLQGIWNFDKQEASFRCVSDVQPAPLLRLAGRDSPWSNTVVFLDPPTISAEGRAWKSGDTLDWRIIGDLKTARFSVRSLVMESAKGAFAWDSDKWFARDVQVKHSSGSIQCDAMAEPGRVRMKLESDANPVILAPLLGKPFEQILVDWRFYRPPWISVRAEGPSFQWDRIQLSGEATVGRCEFQGKMYRDGKVAFRFVNGRLEYDGMEFDGISL